ncbi:MAG: HEAT repeat domain-containing protein [Bryobacteraceae bacterium]
METLALGMNDPDAGRLAVPALNALGHIGSLRALGAVYSVAVCWTPPSAEARAAADELASGRLFGLQYKAAISGDFRLVRDLESRQSHLERMMRMTEHGPCAWSSAAIAALERMADGNVLEEPGITDSGRFIVNDVSDWPRYEAPALQNTEPTIINIEELIAALKHDDRSVSAGAAASLARSGDPRVVVALVKVLDQDLEGLRRARAGKSARERYWNNPNEETEERRRELAAKLLGVIGDCSAVPALVAALKGPRSYKVRAEAALSLGSIGDPSAAPALIALFDDSLAESLKREESGDIDLTDLLLGSDGSSKWDCESTRLRRAAIGAMGAIYDPGHLGVHRVLSEALENGGTGVQGAARSGLLLQRQHKVLLGRSGAARKESAIPATVHGIFDLATLTELAGAKRCLMCGGEMQKQQFSLTCSNGHEKLNYFAFDNSYATQSKALADLLAARGYRVQKAEDRAQWNIFAHLTSQKQ